MLQLKTADRIDPDPVAIAALLVSVCTLVLDFSNYSRSCNVAPDTNPGSNATHRTTLDQLRIHTETLNTKIDRLIRSIERGSEEPDAEFYDGRFRLDQSHLFLNPDYFETFSENLAVCFAETGLLCRWIYHCIKNNPDLAYRIGKSMELSLNTLADRLNSIIADGKTNRYVLIETKSALQALISAIELEEMRRN